MDYQKLANHSRVWIYQSNRALSEEECREIERKGKSFVREWAAHGADLSAAFAVFYNRFLVLFVDEKKVPASGCSIDSSVGFMKNLEGEYQIKLFDRLDIAYKENGVVKNMQLADFQEAISNGKVGEDTIVFNNLVENKADFENAWEIPLKNSWHAQLMV